MTLNESKLRKIGFLGGKAKYAVEILHSEQIFIAFVCQKHGAKENKPKNQEVIRSTGFKYSKTCGLSWQLLLKR